MTEQQDDSLEAALTAALNRGHNGGSSGIEQAFHDALRNDQTERHNAEVMQSLNNVLEGKNIALNDSAGLARIIGAPLTQDRYL